MMNLLKTLEINDVAVMIAKQDIDKLKKSTSLCHPKEACSLLYGEVLGHKIIVREIHNISNTSKTLNQFFINKELEEKSTHKASYPLIGIYHSHPNNSQPSLCDMVNMEKKNILWIIGYLKKIKEQNAFFKINSYYLNNSKLYNLKMEKLV